MHIQHWMRYADGSATASEVDAVIRPVLATRGYLGIANTMPVSDMTKTLWVNFGAAATGDEGPRGLPVHPGQLFELTQDKMTALSIHTAGATITFSWVEGTRA